MVKLLEPKLARRSEDDEAGCAEQKRSGPRSRWRSRYNWGRVPARYCTIRRHHYMSADMLSGCLSSVCLISVRASRALARHSQARAQRMTRYALVRPSPSQRFGFVFALPHRTLMLAGSIRCAGRRVVERARNYFYNNVARKLMNSVCSCVAIYE